MKDTVVLVVDIQTEAVEKKPYNVNSFIKNIQTLLQKAREKNIEVIYVQHSELRFNILQAGTYGWSIYQPIAPQKGELVIEKHHLSAFRGTNLLKELQQRGVKHLILCGMLAEYCVDTTCRVAFEHGFDITIPRGCTTTFDNKLAKGKDIIAHYENVLWGKLFADVVPLDALLEKF